MMVLAQKTPDFKMTFFQKLLLNEVSQSFASGVVPISAVRQLQQTKAKSVAEVD